MIVRNVNTNEEVRDYIGDWYPMQNSPQPLYLSIDGRGKYGPTIEVCYNGISTCSPDEWKGIHLRVFFDFPRMVLSHSDAQKIIEEFQGQIDKLSATFAESDLGNGLWDDYLIDTLSNDISDYLAGLLQVEELELDWYEENSDEE